MNSLNLFSLHCVVGFLVRIFMILFGAIQDEISEVKYTDVDYKVFTDAARHVLNGNSPYERHTYRYSPFVAYILIPNIIIHPAFGKLFFSICDILLCRFVWKLLKMNNVSEKKILWSVYFWLYNPVAIIISTRGNGDSLSSLIVLSTLLSLKYKNYLLAGLFHGLSIHFRIYPIAFSLCMYLSIVDIKTKKKVKQMSTIKKIYNKLYPTYSRINLVFSCIVTLISVTGIFYYLYGYTFLFESLLYHIKRTDVRHNFSVFFYLQYLSSAVEVSIIQKILMMLPQLVLILVISFVYGSVHDIYFCQFLIAFVMVTYNTVVTCQYFIWFLSLVPLIIPDLKFSYKEAVFTIAFWGGAQIGWLYPAYLLEFQNQNTFIYIWLMGIVFFCANIFAITRFIRWYNKSVKFD